MTIFTAPMIADLLEFRSRILISLPDDCPIPDSIDDIDRVLRQVPPGQNNDVDLALGRLCAELTEDEYEATMERLNNTPLKAYMDYDKIIDARLTDKPQYVSLSDLMLTTGRIDHAMNDYTIFDALGCGDEQRRCDAEAQHINANIDTTGNRAVIEHRPHTHRMDCGMEIND